MHFNIEKTSFPFVKTTTANPKTTWWYQCIGFHSFHLMYEVLRNDTILTYDFKVLNQSVGKEITCEFYRTQPVDRNLRPEFLDKDPGMDAENDAILLYRFRDCPMVVVFSMLETYHLSILYDTVFPLCFKTRQFILINWRNNDNSSTVPFDLIKSTAEYLGATLIATLEQPKNEKDDVVQTKVAEMFRGIASNTPGAIIYTDKTREKLFSTLSKLRFGKLDKIKSLKLDKLAQWEDPMKNSILHIGLFNDDIEVFHYLIKKYPDLINRQNIFGQTPLHLLPLYITRKNKHAAINWKKVWKLPIDFSLKDSKGVTCLDTSILGKYYTMDFFNELINNEKNFNEAKKHAKMDVILADQLWSHIQHEDDNKLLQKVVLFVKCGACLGPFENDKSLLMAAIKGQKTSVFEKLLELGAIASARDIVEAFNIGRHYYVKRLATESLLNQWSVNELTKLVPQVVQAKMPDLVKFLIKKGCKIELFRNKEADIASANLIARANCCMVFPLKYLCVEKISEKLFQNDDAQAVKLLETYPKEIQSLFRRRELWQWAMLLDKKFEEKQRRILALYQAANDAVLNGEQYQFKIGNKEFSFIRRNNSWHISQGSKSHELYSGIVEDVDEATGRKTGRIVQKEFNGEVLDELMKDLMWPIDDKYVFLKVIESVMFHNIKNVLAVQNIYNTFLDQFMKPPQWYIDHVYSTYGLSHPY